MKLKKLTRLDKAVACLLLMVMAVQMAAPQFVIFFQTLNHLFSFVEAQVWINITVLGDTLVLLCLMAPLLAYRPQWVYGFIAAIPLGGLLSSVLKKLFNAPRPGDLLTLSDYHALSDVLTGHSFPSGHCITAFAMASVIWACLRNEEKNAAHLWIKTTVLSVALLIGCSRVALGVHWPIDVIAGACVGWMAGLSGFMLMHSFSQFWQLTTVKWTVMFSLLCIAFFLHIRTQATPFGQFSIYFSLISVAYALWTLSSVALKKGSTRTKSLSSN
jgi:membrane-associated phospholipid phosphatase